ncbi:hypothetical protein [Methanoregula sp.]|uniref:hypothetical protein n=1 Tax=Methanoregula sp. TaxID=2052170 RepID=UPI003561AA72
MRYFKPKPGTKSAVRILNTPFADITAFTRVVRGLILTNPLGCTAYRGVKKYHPPLEIVREMYTAKFQYINDKGKQIGTGQEMYDSVDGYELGVAAMISNMANIAAHRGKVRHIQMADHFFVLLKCHDPNGGLFFVSVARDRMTVASYTDDAIRKKVETWADTVPGMI